MKARKGEIIIRATDREGIYVPRFCYHDKLPIAANCRMCLVEVEKAPKPLPACATPVAEGMKIFTHSVKAIGAQRAMMEFLLINHPLDCPICDQGGECELQDLAVGFGRDVSRFVERKRVVKDKNLGPLVSTDMTRCIHCTRCVRFGQDIAGIQEMGATGRGEHMEIGTFIEHSVDHELSGNIIDLCPVGALNSKPFRYRGRGWEMTQYPLISPHDGVGTQLYGHVLRGRLMRVVPRPCEEINETWIADRDRFSYEGIYSEDRLLAPQLRSADGSWREVEWDAALAAAAAAAAGAAAAPAASDCWRIPRARSRSCICWRGWPRAWAAPTSIIGCGSAIFATRRPMRSRPALGAADRRHRPARCAAGDRLESAPRGADPGAPGAQGRAARRARQFHQSGALRVLVPGGALPACRRRTREVAELAAVLRAALGDAAAPAELGVAAGAACSRAMRIGRIAARAQERRAPRDLARGARAARGSRYSELRALARALAAATGAQLGRAGRRRQRRRRLSGRRAAAPRRRRAPRAPPRAATRGRCSSSRCRAICCSTPSPGPMRRCPVRSRRWRSARCVVAVTPYASAEMKPRRARAAAGRHLCRDLGHLREPRGPLAELRRAPRDRSGAVAPGVEDPARARQSARSAALRLPVLGSRCAMSSSARIAGARRQPALAAPARPALQTRRQPSR